eukprot:821184_1
MSTCTNTKSQWLFKLATFGVGTILGYTYYQKKLKESPSHIPRDEATKWTIDTDNVELPNDIDQCFSVALSAAYAAGELINKFIDDKQSKSQSLSTKSNIRDLVTLYDKKCEDIILSKIQSAFPTHRIIAEESCVDNKHFDITDEPTWFIDPIDGTTNFVHGLPFCCVCIGLRVNKIPILGIVHCPVIKETFHGILGRGSYVVNHTDNTKTKLQTNPLIFDNDEAIKKAVILTEPSGKRKESIVHALNRRMYDILYRKQIRAVRVIGTCGIDMCWVAMGRADVFFCGVDQHAGPKPWDFTAAEVIVSEAGGITCLPEGKIFDCTQGRVLCCNNIKTAKYVVGMGLYKPSDLPS